MRSKGCTWTLASLGGLVLLIAATVLVTWPRPSLLLTQAQIEQRGLKDAQVRGIGLVRQINAYTTTLGRLRTQLHCAPVETVYRTLLLAARYDDYNACDPATRLWVVELRGTFASTWSAQPVRFFYTADGDFMRSESGP